jgi:hypothetical protein
MIIVRLEWIRKEVVSSTRYIRTLHTEVEGKNEISHSENKSISVSADPTRSVEVPFLLFPLQLLEV